MELRGPQRKIAKNTLYTLSAASLLTMSIWGQVFASKNVELALRAIRDGKVKDDVQEIVYSRIFPDREIFNLGERLDGYEESWMKDVASGWDIYTITDSPGNVGFFDITDSGIVSELPYIQKNVTVADGLPTVKYNIYSLEDSLLNRSQLTLPLPQFESDTQLNTNESQETINSHSLYSMYAAFRVDGKKNLTASLQQEPSGKRGGVILTKEGKMLVLSPEEFNTYDFDRDELKAQMEYAFIIDSRSAKSDVEVIESYPAWKNIAYVNEYETCLVTFQDRSGNYKTMAMSLMTLYDEKTKNVGKDPQWMTIPQIIELVNQYKVRNGFDRFFIALPDAASANHLTTSIHAPYTIMNGLIPESVSGWGENPMNKAINGENYNVFRTIGAGPDVFSPAGTNFPFMLTASHAGK